jgi:hypothetical protein
MMVVLRREVECGLISCQPPSRNPLQLPPAPPRAEYAEQLYISGRQPPVPRMELGGFPGDPPRQLRFFNRGTVAAAAAYGLMMLARSAANTENQGCQGRLGCRHGLHPTRQSDLLCRDTAPRHFPHYDVDETREMGIERAN